MLDTAGNITSNPQNDIPYQSLLQEKILFDFRRGLPIYLKIADTGYFLKPTEFLSANENSLLNITGDSQGKPELSYVCEDDQKILMCHIEPIASILLSYVKKAELTPSLSVYRSQDTELKHIITHIDADFIKSSENMTYHICKMAETSLPTSYCNDSRLIAYRVVPSFYEYYALIVKTPSNNKPINVRLHAECFTGDILGSLRCDCQSQLHKALHKFSLTDGGIIIYIRQEGRNIGLLNKIKAYELQNKGLDTVDANLKLGFKLDERDYEAAALILKDLNVSSVNLFTNNPEKIAALEKYNIHINHRVAHYTELHDHNRNYVQTKKERIGHLPE